MIFRRLFINFLPLFGQLLKKSLLLISFICIFTELNAQQRVLLTGKVVDTLQAQSFYNLMIINRTSGRGVFGQPDGHFSVYVNENDSINISVRGYPLLAFRVSGDSNSQMKKVLILQNKVYEKPEVVVRPLKSLQDIKEERANLSLRETRLVTGFEVLQSPITALYQRFSKREQNKQWVAEMQYKDNQTKVLKELLRLYVAYDIVNLSEAEFEEFITFLNMNEDFLKTSSDLELVQFIKEKFEHFKSLK